MAFPIAVKPGPDLEVERVTCVGALTIGKMHSHADWGLTGSLQKVVLVVTSL